MPHCRFPKRFLPVPGYEGYFVSCDGEGWSQWTGRTLKPTPIGGAKHPHHHVRFSIRVNGRPRHVLVHRMVALAFIGDQPTPLHEVNHKNGIRFDNHVENLEWVTRSENVRHAFRTGLNKPKRGSEHWLSKLIESDIPMIRKRLRDGETGMSIAKFYGVTEGLIFHIKHGRAWKHIQEVAA